MIEFSGLLQINHESDTCQRLHCINISSIILYYWLFLTLMDFTKDFYTIKYKIKKNHVVISDLMV